MADHFDKDMAAAELAAKEGLTLALARMVVDEDPAVQAANIAALKAALAAGGADVFGVRAPETVLYLQLMETPG